jgi:hypothetical protein
MFNGPLVRFEVMKMKIRLQPSWKLIAAALVIATGPAVAQSTQGNNGNQNITTPGGPSAQADLITIQSQAGGNKMVVFPPGAGDREGTEPGCLTGKPVCGPIWHCGWPNGGHQAPSC